MIDRIRDSLSGSNKNKLRFRVGAVGATLVCASAVCVARSKLGEVWHKSTVSLNSLFPESETNTFPTPLLIATSQEATPTLTATITATLEAMQAQGITNTPVYALTPSATGTPDLRQVIWSGQAKFNSLREDYQNSEVLAFKNYLTQLATSVEGKVDSALTALVNPVRGEEFDSVPDPLSETGMQLGYDEINAINYGGNVLEILNNNPNVKDLMKPLSNDPNKSYIGVWGRGHDRDAITAVLAAGLRYQYWNLTRSGMSDGGQTLSSVIVNGDPQTTAEIRQWQALIVDRTREADLGTSGNENDRRRTDPNDASGRIDSALRLPDQIEVCEEIRGESPNQTREGQPQILVPVRHVDGGADTLDEANVSNEIMLFVLVFDNTNGKWDVVSLTSRGFSNDPLNGGNTAAAVSGNELEPCGLGAFDLAETPTPIPTTPFVLVTPTGAFVVTPTPNGQFTITPAPTNVDAPFPINTSQPAPTADIDPTDAP